MTTSSSILNNATISCFILVTAVALMIFGNVVEGLNTTVVDHSCDQNTWGDNQEYGDAVTDVLDEVVFGVPADPDYLDYWGVTLGDDEEIYGYGECDDVILMYECYDCMMVAHVQLNNTCGDAMGGTMQLADCKIRYENYDFYPN